MYLVLSINLLFFIFSPFSYSSSSVSDALSLELYTSYISKTCLEKEDCLNYKLRKFKECSNEVCRENLLTFEKVIVASCKTNENFSGCLSQYNFSAAMCNDSKCISDISDTLKKDLKPEVLQEIVNNKADNRIINKPAQKMVSVLRNDNVKETETSPNQENNVSTKVSTTNPTNIGQSENLDKITYEPIVSVQKEMMNLSKKVNEDKCTTIECLEKIEKVYSKLSEVDKPNENIYTSNDKYKHIPPEVISIYLNDGPWSPKMYEFFKSNEDILGVKNDKYTLPNCVDYSEKDCSKIKSEAKSISEVMTYFRNDELGGTFAKEVFKLNLRSEHQILCSLRYRKLPRGKYPFRKQVTSYTDESNYFESFNPYYFSASSKLECLEKFKDYEQTYKARLKELGNYPSRSSYSFTELGKTGQIPAPILNYIKGDCHSFRYIPNGEEDNPNLSWLQNSSNKKVLEKKSYIGLTRNECRFMANKDLYKADPSKWEEYIFFIGNVPFVRFSSKAIPQYLSLGRFQKFPAYKHISAPKCKVSYKSAGNILISREYSLNEEYRDCNSICSARKDSLKKEHSDFKCSEMPGMNSNPMYGFIADIYVEDSKEELKSCEYYNYHWSKNPIRKFLVKNKSECLSISVRKSITSAQEYLDYYRFKNNSFYDLDIKFNGSSILKYTTSADCTIGHLTRIGGKTSKHISTKKINVKTEQQCYKACLDYKIQIENVLSKSPSFISCELGRSAYSPLVLNFKKAENYDPFIAVMKNDSKNNEEYFKESFNELWHGYPYIYDLSSDN